MNEVTESMINEALAKVLEAASATGEFVTEQVPEVLQQLLAWSFASSLITFSLMVAVTAVTLWIGIKKALPWVREGDSYDPREFVFLFMGLFYALAMVIISCLANPITWVKVWIAPKLFLFEYAASLVK